MTAWYVLIPCVPPIFGGTDGSDQVGGLGCCGRLGNGPDGRRRQDSGG